MVAALQAVGGAVKYTEYPQVGHEVWTIAYVEEDLPGWLLGRSEYPSKLPGWVSGLALAKMLPPPSGDAAAQQALTADVASARRRFATPQ